MKKLVLLLLVTLGLVLGSVPYNEDTMTGGRDEPDVIEVDPPETIQPLEDVDEDAGEVEPEEKADVTGNVEEQTQKSGTSKGNSKKAESNPVKTEEKEVKDTESTPMTENKTTEQAQESIPASCEKTEEPAAQPAPAYTPVSYSPQSVVSKAVAKCQANGMVTTTDNLVNLLNNGSITQAEYDEYYPYDGLGYYSVYVETDLNKASTTSGRRLSSEDEIAQYIADMMVLESDPIFNISYAGVTNRGGTEFYEFRCYR